jgi:catechol 2,3-dioxygenase-like lactoylglutathione lyase family enzyme
MSTSARQRIAAIALVVDDYDRAIDYYTTVLGFRLLEDRPQGEGKRWVVVAPPGDSATSLVLAKAVAAEQSSRIGNQTGGRVFLFLHTDDFRRDHAAFKTRGVDFTEDPRQEEYGTVAVFSDLYGNKWDLIQPAS